MTDDITISVPAAEDWDDFYRLICTAFNHDGDEASSATERLVWEPERSLIARRDGDIVGTAAIYTRQMAVPGAVAPTAHVTLISVAPTARRKGILTRFMRQHFDDIRAAGEPIAALWASEGRIYQRFGYGLAARRTSIRAESREASLSFTPLAGGRLREGTPADLRDTITKIYDEVYATRPGWSERHPQHWDNTLIDTELRRSGATTLRAVIHEGEHGVDGYALWRVKGDWGDGGPAGEVRVLELATTAVDAYSALWRFLLTVDLTTTTNMWSCSVDEPLFFMINEPRRLNLRMSDALWLRIIDLPRALAARRYACPVDVVLEVTDPLIGSNSGRWRVTGSREAATCTSTVDPADLSCDIRALGAAYLGGTPLDALAGGGHVRELRPGTLGPASTAFGWHRSPSSIEIF